jgi:hypothetical protein
MKHLLSIIAIVPLLVVLGCNSVDHPDLGYVEGTVTLDGEPVEGAYITFFQQGSRPSSGKTDENGYYELYYTNTAKGATPGEHTVRITTHEAGDESEGIEGTEEKIPAKYNANTELTRTVEPGNNEINFELEPGEIVVEEGN